MVRMGMMLEKQAELEARLVQQEEAMGKVVQSLRQRGIIEVRTEGGIVVAGGVPSGHAVPGMRK